MTDKLTERVSLNLEDRCAELQAELQLAYTRAQNAVEDAERERDQARADLAERDATIAKMRDAHGGLSCEAAEEDRYGLGYGYADFQEQVRERDATIARLIMERDICHACIPHDEPFDDCVYQMCIDLRAALAEQPSPSGDVERGELSWDEKHPTNYLAFDHDAVDRLRQGVDAYKAGRVPEADEES